MQVVDEEHLQPLQRWPGPAGSVIAVAAKFGSVRLIDNLIVPGRSHGLQQ